MIRNEEDDDEEEDHLEINWCPIPHTKALSSIDDLLTTTGFNRMQQLQQFHGLSRLVKRGGKTRKCEKTNFNLLFFPNMSNYV